MATASEVAEHVIYRHMLDVDAHVQAISAGQIIGAETVRSDCVEVWVLHAVATLDLDVIPTMRLRVYGTGHRVPGGWRHVATCRPYVVSSAGRLVWHVFEEMSDG